MKKSVRLVIFVLVIAMLSCSAMAATVYNVTQITDVYEDCKIFANDANNKFVKFSTGHPDGSTEAYCVYDSAVKFELSFTPLDENKDHMVFLLKDGDLPTDSNIYYINQNSASATQKFTVYPSDLLAGNYNLFVSSETGYEKVGSLSAADVIKPAEYDLGDVNNDGRVDSSDALWVLQYVAQVLDEKPTDNQLLAGRLTKGDVLVDSSDALLMLQYVAQLIGGF